MEVRYKCLGEEGDPSSAQIPQLVRCFICPVLTHITALSRQQLKARIYQRSIKQLLARIRLNNDTGDSMKFLIGCAALIFAQGIDNGFTKELSSQEEPRSLAEQVRSCIKMPANLSGNAIIEFTLRDEGNVTDIEVVKAAGLANYLVGLVAVNGVKRCQPYKTSIRGRVRVPFTFRAED